MYTHIVVGENWHKTKSGNKTIQLEELCEELIEPVPSSDKTQTITVCVRRAVH